MYKNLFIIHTVCTCTHYDELKRFTYNKWFLYSVYYYSGPVLSASMLDANDNHVVLFNYPEYFNETQYYRQLVYVINPIRLPV